MKTPNLETKLMTEKLPLFQRVEDYPYLKIKKTATHPEITIYNTGNQLIATQNNKIHATTNYDKNIIWGGEIIEYECDPYTNTHSIIYSTITKIKNMSQINSISDILQVRHIILDLTNNEINETQIDFDALVFN